MTGATGTPMTRTEIRALCETLGFDPAIVQTITLYPTYVELTVVVPIVDDRTASPD
jgi:hypothetical protein